jgi:hypothetical protein
LKVAIEYCPLSNKDSFQPIMMVFYTLRRDTLEFTIDMIFGINNIDRNYDPKAVSRNGLPTTVTFVKINLDYYP